jgi:hypothetical protein
LEWSFLTYSQDNGQQERKKRKGCKAQLVPESNATIERRRKKKIDTSIWKQQQQEPTSYLQASVLPSIEAIAIELRVKAPVVTGAEHFVRRIAPQKIEDMHCMN